MSRRLARISLGFLVLAWPALAAPPLVQTQGLARAVVLTGAPDGKGGVTVHLSDEVQLQLSVDGRPPLEVELPAKVTLAEAWSIRPAGPPTTKALDDGRTRWSQVFDLEPLQEGKQPLLLEPLRYREKDGPWRQATWKPIPILVATQLKADMGELHDIPPIEVLPAEEPWPSWVLFVAGVPVLVVLVLLGWVWWRRRMRQVLPLSAGQAALCELNRLARLIPMTAAQAERYHTLLSGLVRRYVERRFELPASRQTTPEFLEALGRSAHLTEAQRMLLGEFLERCDIARFAPITSSAEVCREAGDLARAFVEQTTPDQDPGRIGPIGPIRSRPG